jgi:hypothetical protein
MRVYMLWYKESAESKEIVVSALRDYYKGEQVAEQLEFSLCTVGGKPKPYEIGITRTLMNRVILDFQDESDDGKVTWIIYRQGEWFLDSDEEE